MSIKVTWHGHSNFQIEGDGVSLLVDPFFTGNPKADCAWHEAPAVDAVLVTHMHGDHSGDSVEICKRDKATLCAIVEISTKMVEFGLPAELVANRIGFNIGGTYTVKGAEITMTEAFHSSEVGAPTGFIITMPSGFTIYHAGDTGIFINMNTWGIIYNIDLALLPVGGTFTMDARQAALAAGMLKAKQVIPMHWGTFPVLAQTTDEFTAFLAATAPNCKALAMQPGQTVSF